MPYLKLAAVEDPVSGAVTLFALNRNLEGPMVLDVALHGFGTPVVVQALQLRHNDLKATNTRDEPENVAPTPLLGARAGADHLRATLAPASWNLIRFVGRDGSNSQALPDQPIENNLGARPWFIREKSG